MRTICDAIEVGGPLGVGAADLDLEAQGLRDGRGREDHFVRPGRAGGQGRVVNEETDGRIVTRELRRQAVERGRIQEQQRLAIDSDVEGKGARSLAFPLLPPPFPLNPQPLIPYQNIHLIFRPVQHNERRLSLEIILLSGKIHVTYLIIRKCDAERNPNPCYPYDHQVFSFQEPVAKYVHFRRVTCNGMMTNAHTRKKKYENPYI
jgi:hypothetical protein